MNKVSDYREHAAECQIMARQSANQEHRQMLLDMAKTWQMLADERLKKLRLEGKPED